MPVHEIAQRGFDREATTYERTRPSYPAQAVAWLVEHLGLGPGVRSVDVAAGTGKLTRLLATTRADLLAVEPVEGMRAILRDTLPAVPVTAATAEQLPFASRSVDAVTVAQAFHWFDADAALPELRRVLRPAGRLGLLWNARDRGVDWVDRVWAVMDRVEKRAPWRERGQWSEAALPFDGWFGPVHRETFAHEQPLTPDDVVGRLKGVSHVAVLPAAEQARVLDEVREILATHPDTAGRDELRIPYRVDAYWCERLP
jgi:ubiquinone/menaquinone biosynthesis C-methylase UbiE